MNEAWVEPALTHNLEVLASLGGAAVGTKLKFDQATGKFDIDDRRVQSVRRWHSGDSVTHQDHFATPMRRLLQEAQKRIWRQPTAQAHFNRVVGGLARLRQTYEGDRAKVRALDEVLKSVEGLAPTVREAGDNGMKVVALRRKYHVRLVYAIRQMNYLDVGRHGVCRAFVIDWGRRILASNKASYAASKKRDADNPFAPTLKLSLAEHARMQDKVVGRVLPQQKVDQELVDNDKDPWTSFQGVAKYEHVYLAAKQEGRFSTTATGQAVFQKILHAARELYPTEDELVMLVELEGESREDGHALGLHLYGDGHRSVHLFDPNVGEFRFTPDAVASLRDFSNDLMNNLYTKQGDLIFNSWDMQRLYRTWVR